MVCTCDCCKQPKDIYFQKEMDYDTIKEDFKNTLIDEKMNLKLCKFDFPLLAYYLIDMTSNIFTDSTEEKYKYDTLDKSTSIVATNKVSIILYDSILLEKEMKSNNITNEDYNLMSELVDTQLFQKYIFRNTKYRIRQNALRHITDLVMNNLKNYMDKHGIKKLSVYDKSDRENIQLITVFVRPSYLSE